jgi:hypothetical protein
MYGLQSRLGVPVHPVYSRVESEGDSMTRAICGKVEFLSGFAAGNDHLIKIDGRQYAAAIDLERFPVAVGSIVEYRTEGKRAEILAVQQDLLPQPQTQNLFNL